MIHQLVFHLIKFCIIASQHLPKIFDCGLFGTDDLFHLLIFLFKIEVNLLNRIGFFFGIPEGNLHFLEFPVQSINIRIREIILQRIHLKFNHFDLYLLEVTLQLLVFLFELIVCFFILFHPIDNFLDVHRIFQSLAIAVFHILMDFSCLYQKSDQVVESRLWFWADRILHRYFRFSLVHLDYALPFLISLQIILKAPADFHQFAPFLF